MEQQEVDFSGTKHVHLEGTPPSIKRVSWARSVRWFGWGFGETMLPVFILMFSPTLTQAGLINGVHDAIFLLSTPFVGLIADTVSSRTLLIIGLLIYPFIGLSYYIAGVTGLIVFVILARVLNGVSNSLDTIAMDTYLRRMAPRAKIASAFGYVASWANAAWLVAALMGAYLVQFMTIGQLLLLVTPFSLLALIPLVRAPKDHAPPVRRISLTHIGKPLVRFLKEIAAMRRGMRSVVLLMFLFDVAAVVATFFIPIDAYQSGASLSAVALLVVISALPSLGEFWLAEFIDGSKHKRTYALVAALGVLPFLFICASFATTFAMRLIIALGIETAAIFGSLALQSYATMLSRRDRYGEVASVLEGATTFGGLIGPVAIGILADAFGFPIMFTITAVIFTGIAYYFYAHPIERQRMAL